MDAAVQALASFQRWLFWALPSLGAWALSAGLVLRPGRGLTTDAVWVGGPLLLALLALVPRARRRFSDLAGGATLRDEVEGALYMVVVAYSVVELVPPPFFAAAHGIVFLNIMLCAGFLAPTAAATAFLLSACLEGGLGWYKHGASLAVTGVHVVLLAAFASINLATVRAEIARMRRASKHRVDSELHRVREAARSYRLQRVSQGPVAASAPQPASDPEHLVVSSVEHLELSLRFMLYLLRRALSLRTAALVWLSPDRRWVQVREASSVLAELDPGPFATTRGIFAACLECGGPAVLEGARSQDCFPLYPEAQAPTDGSVGAVPVFDGSDIVGVLVVHTTTDGALDASALHLLADAAQFVARAVRSERVFVALEGSKTDQGKLYFAVDQLSKARTEAEVIEAGVRSARQFAAFDFAAVTVHHAKTRRHEICAVSGPGSDTLVGAQFEYGGDLVTMVVDNRHVLPYGGIFSAGHQAVFGPGLPAPDMPSLIVLPLQVHDVVLGTLILGSETDNAFSDAVRPTLEVLARHVAVSLANARMLRRLEDLATTDGLTGLLNKRALIEAARLKLKSSHRFKKPLSVLIGDIDHFKKVNDTHGHDIGDVVIRGFAEVLRRSKRETDAVGRFGGEEFVVVCEETDEEGARLLAERVRQELENTQFHAPSGSLRVTCSLGVATFPRAGQDWDALFKAADEALYASKRGGRNRVSVWKPTMRGAA